MNHTDLLKRAQALPDERREELTRVLAEIIRVFVDEDRYGLLTTSGSNDDKNTLVLLNCDEMQAMGLAMELVEHLDFMNTEDAPPKEMFN